MLFDRIPGRAYLAIAIIIFAASTPISGKLAQIGAQMTIDGRNPISFCNVLFVGNLCALITLSFVYRHKWSASSLGRLSLVKWIILITIAILLGALAPSLIFFALERTTASNVVLIGQIQSPLTLALSVLFLQKKINWWMFVGETVSVLGILLILILQTSDDAIEMLGFNIGRGELMAGGAAVIMAVATIIRIATIGHIPLGIFTIFRTAVGTIVFFVLVAQLFGLGHFMDVLRPVVWQWISIYGVVIVAGGQIIWFRGLDTSSFAYISYAGYLIPIFGILAAYLILGEIPTVAQYIGGSIIVIGAILNQIGIFDQHRKSQRDSQQETEGLIGFKGI